VLDHFTHLCKAEWFHGAIDQKEANIRLHNKESGYYLIRFSSSKNSFTLSRISLDKTIIHQRISKVVEKGDTQWAIHSKTKIKCYKDLPELVEDVQSDLDLKYPCNDSRIFNIIFTPTESSYMDKSTSFETLLEQLKVQNQDSEEDGAPMDLKKTPFAPHLTEDRKNKLKNGKNGKNGKKKLKNGKKRKKSVKKKKEK